MGFETDPWVEWSTQWDSASPQLERASVADQDKFDELFRELSELAKTKRPFVAEFATTSGARLGVGLGPEATVLTFKESDDPPYFLSVGDGDGGTDEDVGFYFQGRWSEFPGTAVIPHELAREAAVQFLSTGKRPDAVEWDEV